MNVYSLYINGDWIENEFDDYIEVENPGTKEIIGKVPAANEEEVNKAVEGALKAFPKWKNLDPKERINYVQGMYEYFKKKVDKIAKTVHSELGCPLDFAKQRHVEGYFANIEDFIKLAKEYEFVEVYDGYEVYKEPVGVIGALTPWNFPFGQIVKKVIPALLMGNVVVLKPSQGTPLTSYYWAEAAHEVGLPDGVFQLVTGRGSEVGNVLATHKDVDMVSFTGSTKGGIEISKLAADTVKRVSLELGGKSPGILLEGADYEKALKSILGTVYLNVGQSCSAKTRLLAPRKDKEKIEKLLIDITKEYKFGSSQDENADVGALQSKKQFDKVSGYVEVGKDEAELLYQGEKFEGEGYYFPPTIFTEVDQNAKIAQEEIFGPVLSIIYYDNVDEAIEIANNTIYGLSGMVFGPEEEARKVAKEIRTGQLQINDAPFTHNAPFGGFKQSGIGREGSIYGLEEYIELKTIFV
ncbi:MAG: aldehyde dehydrogenase family protein [Tissierellia bacterium]|jgi:aldehyde dehydrogenase (NAD+)|nr:aldehyde dehydrogenase family protein [Tissierellia bacterium]